MMVQIHGKISMKYFESFDESRRRGDGDTTSGSLDGVADTPPLPYMPAP